MVVGVQGSSPGEIVVLLLWTVPASAAHRLFRLCSPQLVSQQRHTTLSPSDATHLPRPVTLETTPRTSPSPPWPAGNRPAGFSQERAGFVLRVNGTGHRRCLQLTCDVDLGKEVSSKTVNSCQWPKKCKNFIVQSWPAALTPSGH